MKAGKNKNKNGAPAKKENVYISFTLNEFKKFSNDLMKVSKAIDKAKKEQELRDIKFSYHAYLDFIDWAFQDLKIFSKNKHSH